MKKLEASQVNSFVIENARAIAEHYQNTGAFEALVIERGHSMFFCVYAPNEPVISEVWEYQVVIGYEIVGQKRPD
jgi:hypothetical protein